MKYFVVLYFFIFATMLNASELFLLKYGYQCSPSVIEWCAQKAPSYFPLIVLYSHWKHQTVCASAPALKILAQEPQKDDQKYADAVAYGCQLLTDNDECDDLIIDSARYQNSSITQGLKARSTFHVKNAFELFTNLLMLYAGGHRDNTVLMDMIDMLIQHKSFCHNQDYIAWCLDHQMFPTASMVLCLDKGLRTKRHKEVFRYFVQCTALDGAMCIVDDACKQGLYLDDFLSIIQDRINQVWTLCGPKLQSFLENLCLKHGKILNISDVVQKLYKNNYDQALRNIIKIYKNYHAKLLRFCMKTEGAEKFFSSFSDVDFHAISSYRNLVLYFLRNDYDIFRHNKLFACSLIHHCLIKNDNIDDLLVKALSADRYDIARTLLLSGAHIPEHELSKVIQHVCAFDSGVITLLIEYGYAIPLVFTTGECFDKEKLYYTRSLGDVQIAGKSLKQKSSHNSFVRCAVDCWHELQCRYKVIDKINNLLELFPEKKLQRRLWHFILVTICDEKYDYDMYQSLRKDAFVKSKCTFGSLVASVHSSNFKRLIACIEDFMLPEKEKLFKQAVRFRSEQYKDAIARCIVHQWNFRLHSLLKSAALSDVTCICST